MKKSLPKYQDNAQNSTIYSQNNIFCNSDTMLYHYTSRPAGKPFAMVTARVYGLGG